MNPFVQGANLPGSPAVLIYSNVLPSSICCRHGSLQHVHWSRHMDSGNHGLVWLGVQQNRNRKMAARMAKIFIS